MAVENKERRNYTKERVVLVEKNGESSGYTPVRIIGTSENPLSLFLEEETKKVQDQLNRLREEKVSKTKAHGRRRPLREIRDIRDQRETEENRLKELLIVLKGERLKPIRIEEVEGDRKVYLTEFNKNNYEGEFWMYVKRKGQLKNLAEFTEKEEKGLEIVRKLFSAGYKKKFGTVAESNKAYEQIGSLHRELEEDISDENFNQVAELLVSMTDDFGD